jgi:hypothetical protein
MTNEIKKLKRRLLDKSQKDSSTGCRMWQGSVTSSGYGCLSRHNKTVYAHRIAWEVYNGPVPEDSVVHHTCANRLCINPNHLQIVTQQNNTAEMLGRRTYEKRIAELENRLEKCTCDNSEAT